MIRLHLQALADLWRRHATVWRTAWAVRRELDTPRKSDYEVAFQPAHLELVEKPVHPAPRWTARVVVALSAVTLLVTLFAKLDIVATATGKLVPTAQVKLIQPAITGVVREIDVQDGERVTAGQLLVKLDSAQAAADEDNATSTRVDNSLAVARAKALLKAQHDHAPPVIGALEGAPTQRLEEIQRLAEGVWREYADKMSSAQAELAKREAELESAQHEIGRLAATGPLARSQADTYKALAKDKYVAQNDYLDKEQAALDKEHALAGERGRAHELVAAISQQQAEIETISSQFRREQLDALEKATEQLAQSRNDETKARTRQALMSLTAPVAGTVQQLSVHTLGGVVTTAQALMEIVPDDALEVDAMIENKDIGFVYAGQRAAVKVQAFPYARYGLLEGDVISVSNDATQDRKLGLVFPVRIRLKTNRMRIENKWIALTPGMSVTAEVKTGKQSVASYLLGPLVDGARESLHER